MKAPLKARSLLDEKQRLRRQVSGSLYCCVCGMLDCLIGEGNGTPLQDSCLGNPTDGGAWWAAVHGGARSWTWLKWLHFHFSLSCIGEANGSPLQYSCLENPRDRGAWWAAVYGVAQNRTWLKWLSSSSKLYKLFEKGYIIYHKNIFFKLSLI